MGVSSYDEMTIRCKARCLSKSYIKNKPVPYGIRLYACVGWKNRYLHSICDNGKGSKVKMSPSQKFASNIPIVKPIIKEIEKLDKRKKKFSETASSQWVTQMAMQTYIKPDPSGKRMFVMDSFYGRHKVADVTKIVTNGEARVICTMKLLFVNSGDKSLVKYVLNHIKKLSQGIWFLLWVTVDGVIQKNCGYIVFKDKRPVLFYTNDLKDTPKKRIQGVNEESVRCVGGLLILKRWTDECNTKSK